MKELLLGDYGKVVPSEQVPDSHVEIIITPLDLVTYWKRVGILADFVAGFYSYSFLPVDVAVKDISETPVFHSISTVFNEMVENAAKYSMDKKSNITINLNQYGGIFKMQVENSTSKESAMNFHRVMSEVFASDDLDSLYFKKLEENSQNPSGHSGIGLMMILKDYPAKMGVRIREDDKQAFVLTEVYYQTEE
ncbi:DUF6272 family protein [Leptospira sp. GIMC2001]|uniref:DUF6272 family protein n=1 Tax=Leptospira sp. GIMC2001 TaxID=1513297 RepID=UPI00234916F1|nr:DUF6272 family protein [Leptospira sp. GIMC2001]WCL50314.1 DUF6272 family protein [Leptospira sp. GIMC2001]